MTQRSYVLIANPISGGGSADRVDRAKAVLEKGGAKVEVMLTRKRGDAESFASELSDRTDLTAVIACGGDGTLNEVLNGIAPSQVPVGFLPLGTTNVFAIEAGIPSNVEKACAALLEGEVKDVTLGEAGGRKFVLMLGAGLDAAAVMGVNSAVKRWSGKGAYVLSGLLSFFGYRVPAVEVETDSGERLKGYGLLISNCRSYGGKFVISPQADMTSPTLELAFFSSSSRWRLVWMALKVLLGLRLGTNDIQERSVASVRIRGALPMQIDGDEHGWSPVEVRALPGVVRMLLPKKER